jgi:hypothetical protein
MEYKHLNTDEITHNILFLDFDGVCNSYRCGSYVTSNSETYGIDKNIMPRLKEICVKGNAKIIISSNWRRYGENDFITTDRGIFKNPLLQLEKFIGEYIIGTLTKERHLNKSQALEIWFEDNPDFTGKYAILDDDYREQIQNNPKLKNNFWMTNAEYGLTDAIKTDIINHFKNL